MRILLSLALGLLLVNSSLASTPAVTSTVTPDIASQRVFKQYGVDSEILRAYTDLEESSQRSDGGFEFSLGGNPGVFVVLDRDYWVLASWDPKKDRDSTTFMLNPKDGQSALVISVDRGKPAHGARDKSRDTGFSGYTQREGVVAGSRVTWRRCSTSDHLHSDGSVSLQFESGASKVACTVQISITANSEARRKVLEDCLGSLRILAPTEKKDEPNNPLQGTEGKVPSASTESEALRP